jgi:hypothetical protein
MASVRALDALMRVASSFSAGIRICSHFLEAPYSSGGRTELPFSLSYNVAKAPQELLFGANRFRLSDVSMDATSQAALHHPQESSD